MASLFCCIFSVIYTLWTVYTIVTIYYLQATRPSEVYSASFVRVHCTGNFYRLNQVLNFLYKKKQIHSERIHTADVEFASQWQSMWLCVK